MAEGRRNVSGNETWKRTGTATESSGAAAGLPGAEKERLGLTPGVILAGRYQILALQGEGGNGRVYLARDRRLLNFAAVKMAAKARPPAVEALERERDFLKRLRHPGIPRPLDYLEVPDAFCLVMDLAEGRHPHQIPPKERPEGFLASCLLGLCGILAYLEEQDPPLIHGDIKPDNLFWDRQGRLTLVDFGSAFPLGQPSHGQGTPGFAAPEQYPEEPGEPGTASDIYGLGATLRALLEDQKISFFWTYIIWKCMRRDPAKRWKDARSLQNFFWKTQVFHKKKI